MPPSDVENPTVKLGPVYIARARCENEHTYEAEELVDNPKKKGEKIIKKVTHVEYMRDLWVIWRAPGETKFAMASTDERGYLRPCSPDGTPSDFAPVLLPVKAKLEFHLVRHPHSKVAKKIWDDLNGGSKDYGEPNVLELEKRQTGVDPKGAPVDEALLLVPESKDTFWPKGPKLYDEWLLYRNMPNGLCPPVRKQVERLQRHLGAMRFLVGHAFQPYRPDPVKHRDGSGGPSVGVFDIMCWNSVLMFQNYASKSHIAYVLDETRTRLYEPEFPYEPTKAAADGLIERKESDLYRNSISGAYSGVDPIKDEDRGVVSVEMGLHLEHWLKNDARKPGHVLVCLHSPKLDWVHEVMAPKVRAWSADLEACGFPPPSNVKTKSGEVVHPRMKGVSLANGFRDIRYMTKTGGGAVDASLHKVGIAFDLWMGQTIGGTQDDETTGNYYPIYNVRSETKDAAGKVSYSWTVWGEVAVDQIVAGAVGEFADSLSVIYPHKYDPTSPTGGAETIKAELGKRRYLNISAIANKHKIFNIGPHDQGWKGGKDQNYDLTDPIQFKELVVERLEQQMFIENFDKTAQFFINRNDYAKPPIPGSPISGEQRMKAEASFLKAWYTATVGQPAAAQIKFNSGPNPEKDKFWKRLQAVTATPRFNVGIFEAGKVPDLRSDVALNTIKLPKDALVTIAIKIFDPVAGKMVPFERLWCPAFKGKANHLEWWHFQPREFKGDPLGMPSSPRWLDLVYDIGITEEIVRELYAAPVLTKKAAFAG